MEGICAHIVGTNEYARITRGMPNMITSLSCIVCIYRIGSPEEFLGWPVSEVCQSSSNFVQGPVKKAVASAGVN
jgi:hypothetical protein